MIMSAKRKSRENRQYTEKKNYKYYISKSISKKCVENRSKN